MMSATEANDPWDFVRPILDAHGHDIPTETQRYAVENGMLDHRSVMLVADTGNGKTVCAEARVKAEVEKGNRVAYLVPSRQLKSAKADELEEWADFDVLVAGRDNDAYRDGKAVVATFEGYYQMSLTHPAKVSDISLAVLDDFHYLYEMYRGFTIEKLIASLKRDSKAIFAMSASIGGAENLADWMNAKLIESPEPRKIPIQERVELRHDRQSIRKQVAELIESDDDGPYLVFNKSKKMAESTAREIARKRGWDPEIESETLAEYTTGGEIEPGAEWVALTRVKEELSQMVESMTPEMERIAHLISRGVAYHHAALPSDLKQYVEKLFAEGKINVLSLTTTLASGYDAPVKTVIVADYTRWERGEGSKKIGVWEYEQWIGRAGRPGYDHNHGNAIILAKSREDVEEYLPQRQLERIESHVKEDELLRKFLLELIVTGHKTEDEIRSYLDRTLWMHDTVDDVFGVEYDPLESIQNATAWLAENQFIKRLYDGFGAEPLGEATVSYGFRQYGRYSLIGIRNLYEWLEDTGEVTKMGLVEAICRHQKIQLFEADEYESQDNFIDRLKDADLDPESDYVKTAAVINWYWCENIDVEIAAKFSGLRAEFTHSVAGQVHDVLQFIPELVEVAGRTEVPDWYEIFKLQVKYGVTESQAGFVSKVDGVGRKKVRELDTWLDDIPYDLPGGGLISRLGDLIRQNGPDLTKDYIQDNVHGFGPKLSKRTVDAVIENHSDLG